MAERREGEGASEGAPRIRKTGRRVTTEPVEGYIGEPPADSGEDKGQGAGENDARLIGDKPPHWG